MNLREKLDDLFHEFKKVPSDGIIVSPSGAGQVLVVVTSSTFVDRPEEDRQDLVWRKLIDGLNDEEQAQIEFVYTRTPEEVEDIRNEVRSSKLN